MEFLVRIEVRDRDLPADQRKHLLEEEQRRAQELMADGVLRRIWRLPGKRANISLYSVPSANALHDALTSLPLWQWMELTVETLATHPLEEESRHPGSRGARTTNLGSVPAGARPRSSDPVE